MPSTQDFQIWFCDYSQIIKHTVWGARVGKHAGKFLRLKAWWALDSYKPNLNYSDRNAKKSELRARRTRGPKSGKSQNIKIMLMIRSDENVGKVLLSRKNKLRIWVGAIFHTFAKGYFFAEKAQHFAPCLISPISAYLTALELVCIILSWVVGRTACILGVSAWVRTVSCT